MSNECTKFFFHRFYSTLCSNNVYSCFLRPYSWRPDISVTLASTSLFFFLLSCQTGIFIFVFVFYFFVLTPSYYERCGNNAQFLSECVSVLHVILLRRNSGGTEKKNVNKTPPDMCNVFNLKERNKNVLKQISRYKLFIRISRTYLFIVRRFYCVLNIIIFVNFRNLKSNS